MASSTPIHVMVVDDSATMRSNLVAILQFSEDLELVAEASDGAAAVLLCGQVQPDVVLMDLHMPHMDGITATHILHKRYPHLPILMLTASQDSSFVQKALQAGARGYLLKNVTGDELLTAIRAACQGQPSFAHDEDAALRLGVHLAV